MKLKISKIENQLWSQENDFIGWFAWPYLSRDRLARCCVTDNRPVRAHTYIMYIYTCACAARSLRYPGIECIPDACVFIRRIRINLIPCEKREFHVYFGSTRLRGLPRPAVCLDRASSHLWFFFFYGIYWILHSHEQSYSYPITLIFFIYLKFIDCSSYFLELMK